MKKQDRFKNLTNKKTVADDLLTDIIGFLSIANTRLLLQASGIKPEEYLSQLTNTWTELCNQGFDGNYKETLNEGDYYKAKRVFDDAKREVIEHIKRMVLAK